MALNNHLIRHSSFIPLVYQQVYHQLFKQCKSTTPILFQSSQRFNHNIIPRSRSKLKDSNYNKILKIEDAPSSVIKIKKDPKDKMILIFGGEEGSYVGMCEQSLDDPKIYKMFKQAEEVFGYGLMDVCLNGPRSELIKTKYLLPSIFLANMTALHIARKRVNQLDKQTVVVTSSGIGELNALIFNDVISFEDALRLLKVRTDALQLLADNSSTKSIVIWESAATKPLFICKAAKEWCLRKGVSERDAFCEITHVLHPETKIIGGHREAIEFIYKNADNFSLKKIITLKWDIAYYSSYLKPISEILKPIVQQMQFKEPTIQIISTSGYWYDRKNLISNLVDQVHTNVRQESNFTKIYKRKAKNAVYPLTYELASRRTSSISLRSCNYQAYKKCRTILSS